MESLPPEVLLQIALRSVPVWRGMLVVPQFGRASINMQQIAQKKFTRGKHKINDKEHPSNVRIARCCVNLLGRFLFPNKNDLIKKQICGNVKFFGIEEELRKKRFLAGFNENEWYSVFDYADYAPGDTNARVTFCRIIKLVEKKEEFLRNSGDYIFVEKYYSGANPESLRAAEFTMKMKTNYRITVQFRYQTARVIAKIKLMFDSGFYFTRKLVYLRENKSTEEYSDEEQE